MFGNAPTSHGVASVVDVPVAKTREQHAAFAEHVLPEIEVLYRVARSLTGQAADAEDLVQDTLVRAFRSIEQFDGRYPRAWLLTILRNVERNRHRKRHPELIGSRDHDIEQLDDGRHAREGPEHEVVDRRLDSEVETAFHQLPNRFREVMALVDIEGFSYGEASEALGVPVGTVMSRLHRARKRIRKHLRDVGVDVRSDEA
ncbi:RNA polymerase sigma factor [Haloechinothrix halophila]|uniref:RNA polymerase sigma factor n=1 Tax=Haloechinothrix halophila TaxID=1069073 RepID=UPI000A013282|nr:sigma-70 family RNA polymerase sigma factor [Haloechinothrix halophila]